ncbi:hypothetical protein D1AOALGA4SA_11649 [Olavius algarvensis Delta 1 endosymbiont]|nr:hypothetical protein D1AOALGA4SA_11649 [Olavius algarvensis Delta 1 endosymbiont]
MLFRLNKIATKALRHKEDLLVSFFFVASCHSGEMINS